MIVLRIGLGTGQSPSVSQDSIRRIPAIRTGDGMFTICRKSTIAYIRPWGIGPLGTCLYEDYSLSIGASAKGYDAVCVNYWPPYYTKSKRYNSYELGPDTRLPEPGPNGLLKFFLKKTQSQLR